MKIFTIAILAVILSILASGTAVADIISDYLYEDTGGNIWYRGLYSPDYSGEWSTYAARENWVLSLSVEGHEDFLVPDFAAISDRFSALAPQTFTAIFSVDAPYQYAGVNTYAGMSSTTDASGSYTAAGWLDIFGWFWEDMWGSPAAVGEVYWGVFAMELAGSDPEPDGYVDLIKFDSIGAGLGEDGTVGTHTFTVNFESEFEYIQVTTKAGKAEAVTQLKAGDGAVTDDLGFIVELVSAEDGTYIVTVSSDEDTPKALSYVILGAGKTADGADPLLISYEEVEGYKIETGDNLHANCFKEKPDKPGKVLNQEVLDKKAALEEQKVAAADARFTRKQAHMLEVFGLDSAGIPLKGPK